MTLRVENEVATTPSGSFGDRAAVAIVGGIADDVAREALKIAREESLSRPVLLVDLLGQETAIGAMYANDDLPGVSDAARYGISLGKVARSVPDNDALFVVSGGVETPLADDVLSDHMWGSWSDQCRRAGALLVVAAPADLPAVGMALDQLDGVVMIGDAAAPATHVPVLGRVPTPLRGVVVDAPAIPASRPQPQPLTEVMPPPSRRLFFVATILVALALTGSGAWWLNSRLFRPVVGPVRGGSAPIVMPGESAPVAAIAAATPAAGAAPWTVEVASVNSLGGAMARVRQVLDSLPVPTFAATHPGGAAATWYRLVAGAFASSAQADSLLRLLRTRGVLGPEAGRVIQAPLAWLLEENVTDDQLAVRLFGWRQQGLPAYALLDPTGTSRIYFGAFEHEVEARLLTPLLDSLNLYATLATRIGSVR